MLTRRSLIASFLALPVFSWFKPKGKILDGGFRHLVNKGRKCIVTKYKDGNIKNVVSVSKHACEFSSSPNMFSFNFIPPIHCNKDESISVRYED